MLSDLSGSRAQTAVGCWQIVFLGTAAGTQIASRLTGGTGLPPPAYIVERKKAAITAILAAVCT